MSLLRKTMLYLGLAPDDEFEEYDEPERTAATGPQRSGGTVQPLQRQSAGPRPVTVVPMQTEPDRPLLRPMPLADGPVQAVRPPVVRPVPPPAQTRPTVVAPTGFSDAQEIADRFMSSQPVIMNLQALERDLSRRLIDFASGLCYGLAGHMEKVAHQVFLLTPADVELHPEERRRLTDPGLAEP